MGLAASPGPIEGTLKPIKSEKGAINRLILYAFQANFPQIQSVALRNI